MQDLEPSNLSLSTSHWKKLLLATSLCLLALGTAHAQTLNTNVVANLQSSSAALTEQINKALTASTNMAIAANSGYIVDPTVYQGVTITLQQQLDYNQSLVDFKTHEFYTARDLLLDNAYTQVSQMQSAISSLASAAVDLQKVAMVNDIVNGVSDSATAQAAQNVLNNSNLGSEVTDGQVDAFNSSLQMVNSYASQAGAFFAAANNVNITSDIDLLAGTYGLAIYGGVASYDYGRDMLTLNFAQTYGLAYNNFLSDSKIDSNTFFNNPSFYGGN
jgi:hypothetical protein